MSTRRLLSIALVLSLVMSVQGDLTAQIPIGGPAVRVDRAFVPFGQIVTLSALQVTAVGHDVAGRPARTIHFSTSGCDEQPGQPVELRTDGRMVRFVCFPLYLSDTGETVVGRGAGRGRFIMQTRDLKLSSNGQISGRTTIKSQDYISGFTGALYLRLNNAANEELDVVKVGCWGVNMRSGRDAAWSVEVPPEKAVATASIEVWHLHDPCGRDRTGAFLDDVERAAEVAGTLKEAYVTNASGGGS